MTMTMKRIERMNQKEFIDLLKWDCYDEDEGIRFKIDIEGYEVQYTLPVDMEEYRDILLYLRLIDLDDLKQDNADEIVNNLIYENEDEINEILMLKHYEKIIDGLEEGLEYMKLYGEKYPEYPYDHKTTIEDLKDMKPDLFAYLMNRNIQYNHDEEEFLIFLKIEDLDAFYTFKFTEKDLEEVMLKIGTYTKEEIETLNNCEDFSSVAMRDLSHRFYEEKDDIYEYIIIQHYDEILKGLEASYKDAVETEKRNKEELEKILNEK